MLISEQCGSKKIYALPCGYYKFIYVKLLIKNIITYRLRGLHESVVLTRLNTQILRVSYFYEIYPRLRIGNPYVTGTDNVYGFPHLTGRGCYNCRLSSSLRNRVL